LSYLLTMLLLFCIPGMVGIGIAKSGKRESRVRARILLIFISIALALFWLVCWLYFFLAFSIGGGNPTFFQIAIAAFVPSIPALLATAFTIFAVKPPEKKT
jgi:uncharacterized membrane protein